MTDLDLVLSLVVAAISGVWQVYCRVISLACNV